MMMRVGALALAFVFLTVGGNGTALAQDRHWSDEAWNPIVEEQGVTFDYIFYREADNHNNGVVVRLHNTNDAPVRYEFRIVFRASGNERVERASGELDAGTMKTGDEDGLFWIPFPDGQRINEVGLRGYRVEIVDSGA